MYGSSTEVPAVTVGLIFYYNAPTKNSTQDEKGHTHQTPSENKKLTVIEDEHELFFSEFREILDFRPVWACSWSAP